MAGTSPVIDLLVAAEPLDAELPMATTADAVDGDGWVPVTALLEDDATLARVLSAIATAWSTDRRDIAAGALLADLGFSLVHRAAVAFLAGRRVPLPGPDDLAVRVDAQEGNVTEVALGRRFACLASSPVAADPGAVVVADEDALLTALLDAVDAILAPLVERLAVASGRPRAALRRHAGDVVAEGFLWAGETLGLRADAFAWGPRACAVAPDWMRCRADFREWRVGDVVQVGRVRSQCCLYYRTENARYCFSCPLKDDEHRLARLAPDEEDAA